MAETLLDYVVSSVPTPLAVGSPGRVKIVVSNGGDRKVLCKLLTVVVTEGEYAQDLLKTGSSPQTAVKPDDKWSFTHVQHGVYFAEPEAEAVEFEPRAPAASGAANTSESKTVTFTAGPRTGESVDVSTEGVYLELSDFTVNSEIGAAAITVIEDAKYDGEATYQQRRTTLIVGKFESSETVVPDPLPVTNLHVSDPSSGNLVTTIDANASVKVNWNGPQATYTLDVNGATYSGSSIVDEGNGQYSCTVPANTLVRDAVFVLTAKRSVGGAEVYRHLTTGVLVKVQTLPGLRVDGLLEALRDLYVKYGTEDHNKLDTQGVQGIRVAGSILPASGSPGTLEIGGDVTMPNGLTVSGGLQALGSLTAQGKIDLTADGQELFTDGGNYPDSITWDYQAAPTDGLIVCDVNAENNDGKGNGGAFAFTYPKDRDEQWAYRVGVSAYANEWGPYGACTLFVPAGRHFSLGARGSCNRTYTWFSLGTNSKPVWKG